MAAIATAQPTQTTHASYERCGHAILRGEFPALVFSGDCQTLGELPGELTSATLYKFAMIDVRLDASQDFARTPHMALPLWDAGCVAPTDGVCFVLSDADHPAVEILRDKGGIEDEHYVIAPRLHETSRDRRLRVQLAAALRQVSERPIVLLGFGDQGARISAMLTCEFGVEPTLIHAVDQSADSQRRAERSGHVVVNGIEGIEPAIVIYTPLMRYERLYQMFEARDEATIAIDNSTVNRNVDHFVARGNIWLEPAADRALRVDGARLALRSHGLPIESAAVMREDMRSLAGKSIRHLTTGHRALLHSSNVVVSLNAPSSCDRFAAATAKGLLRAYVSLRDRPVAPVFAARTMCSELWPEATSGVFPARCAADLGATRFERVMKRHIDGAEFITASQTSAQQAALGIIAAHYATDSPIVEIGSALGGSGMIMAAATDRHCPPFYSIDPETATRHIMRWAFEQQDQLDRLHQIIATSDDAILHLQHLRGRAGLVFIDGLHTYTATAADFANYAPLVRPGGALLIHDVEPARYSVLRVVVERVLADPRFRPICMIDGLLVLERVNDQ